MLQYAGATCDTYVKDLNSYIVMDIGNGHTLAAAFENKKYSGVFEHHTRSLDPEKIKYLIGKLKMEQLLMKKFMMMEAMAHGLQPNE